MLEWLNTIMMVIILIFILIDKYYSKKEKIADYIREVIETSLDTTEFEEFFKAVKVGYAKNQAQIIKKMQETEEELEKLKKETVETVEKFEKINKSLENRITNSQKHIIMLQKKLDKCNKKVRLQQKEKENIE